MHISAERIAQIEARRDEVQASMTRADLPADAFVRLSKEYAEIEPVARAAHEVRRLRQELAALDYMTGGADADADPLMREMAQEEMQILKSQLPAAERALALQLLPRDSADARPAMLEIRAGTGGDEAALFAGDLFRMYERYASNHGWKVDAVEASAVLAQTATVATPVARPALAPMVAPAARQPMGHANATLAAMVAAPPGADNPFLTRSKRLRRARVLLAERQSGAAPVPTQAQGQSQAQTQRFVSPTIATDRSQTVYRFGGEGSRAGLLRPRTR